MKISVHKGCKVLEVHIIKDREKNNQEKMDGIPILIDFKDVYPKEILRLPLKRDIDFTIDLVSGVVQTSKTPYRMNILELNEIKSQIQKLIDKKYVRPSVSPWRALVLFIKKNDGTL